ncbi:MAG: hypothetical protein RL685_6968 [Pseudomonadota bacterium]
MTTRDDFPAPVKRLLALRAAHRCCNPHCRRLTIKPTDTGGTVSTGVAAHIAAAASGGPRFDASQTPEERASAANGIWVCHICSDIIDKDRAKHPADLLIGWRSEHEAWVANEDLMPRLPIFTVSTVQGFSLPTEPAHIELSDLAHLREHSIVLSAASRHELEQLKIRIQFPEPVVSCEAVQIPPGIAVTVRPEKVDWVVSGSGGGSVTINRPARATPNFLIEMDRLVPRRDLILRLRTAVDASLHGLAEPSMSHGDALLNYASGEFLYREGGQLFERHFIVPLDIDGERQVSAQASEENLGTRALLRSMVWG